MYSTVGQATKLTKQTLRSDIMSKINTIFNKVFRPLATQEENGDEFEGEKMGSLCRTLSGMEEALLL